ncbi:MAG: hypothetical protein GY832_26690 [Chloroflexi bacterium]|nr:hypothetical protein [Chloroflexota bacterium]
MDVIVNVFEHHENLAGNVGEVFRSYYFELGWGGHEGVGQMQHIPSTTVT